MLLSRDEPIIHGLIELALQATINTGAKRLRMRKFVAVIRAFVVVP